MVPRAACFRPPVQTTSTSHFRATVEDISYHILFLQCLSPHTREIQFSPVPHLRGGSAHLSVGHISLGRRTCIDPLLLVPHQQEPQPTGIRRRRFRIPLKHTLVIRQPSSLSIMKRQICDNGHSQYVSPLRVADHREPSTHHSA